jgi:hypothetical protein
MTSWNTVITQKTITFTLIYRSSFGEAFRRYFEDIKNHGLLINYFSLLGPFNASPLASYRSTFAAFSRELHCLRFLFPVDYYIVDCFQNTNW